MHITNLWAGSQTSYETVLEARASAIIKAQNGSEPAPMPNLLTVQDHVGVIDVQGSLVNGRAGFLSYFGVTGYGDVRDALVAAVQHPEVNSILLSIDSGGGAVAGVHETAQLISRVDKVKPVVSYTGATEASAALWLGSSARNSFAAETAQVGSVGVIMIHAERSKQLAADGVTVTVIRSGDQKATANPYEPLTDKAKADLEAKAATMHSIFLNHVAGQRGTPVATAKEKYGQGQMFIGKQAVDVGLIDAMGTMEDAFTKASQLGAKVAKPSTGTMPHHQMAPANASLSANLSEVFGDTLVLAAITSDNAINSEGTPMINPLTQEQLVAMAAGVTLEAATDPVVVVAAAPVVGVAAADPAVAADPVVVVAAASDVQVLLEKQVATLSAELLTAKMEAQTNKEALVANATTLEALTTIARNSVKAMSPGLGIKAVAIDTMVAADVVTEHTRVSELFKAKFKVGGVAATNTVEDPKPVKATVDPLFLYAVKSLSK